MRLPRRHGARILVTGSRTWRHPQVIDAQLAAAVAELAGRDPLVLVHGGAVGADMIADRIWRGWMFRSALARPEVHPVSRDDWARYGRSAGHRRNAEMVAAGADLCLAFIHRRSPGATGCARMAERAGIEVRRFRDPEEG